MANHSTTTKNPAAVTQHDALVPEDEFAKIIGGLSRVTIWKRTEKDPNFPKPVKIGARAFRLRSDIDRYLAHLGEEAIERQRALIERGKKKAAAKALKSSATGRKRAA
ncbi:MAG: helix-turn-helix transcriptional regulator [Pseudomonadota bacterium]